MTYNHSNTYILIASTDDIVRKTKSRILIDAGFQVREAATYQDALIQIHAEQSNLLILDTTLSNNQDMSLCRHLKNAPETEEMMILQIANAINHSDTLDANADSYLLEPIEAIELIATSKTLLRLGKSENEFRELKQRQSKFLATLSILTHDLRNILAPILNSIELLITLDPVVPLMQHNARNIIKLQAKNLAGIADKLLDASLHSRENDLNTLPITTSTTSSITTSHIDSQTAETITTHSSTPKRVLVVDDYADVADTLAQWLRLAGYTVQTAYTGAQALESTAEFKPDIVLLDIGLPDSSGFDIAKKLRALPNLQKFLLVAVTGYGQASLRKSVLEAGFDEHFAKPMNFEKLGAIGLHV